MPQKARPCGDQERANTPALHPQVARNIVQEPHLILLEDNGIAQHNYGNVLSFDYENSVLYQII